MINNFDKHKTTKKLRRETLKAIEEYHMLEEGDKVMVCISGGKDSYTMLDMFIHLQEYSPFKFEVVAVNMDQKQPGFPEDVLPAYLSSTGVPFKVIEKDTYKVVKEKIAEGKTTCSLCSRLRRGTLYEAARNMGANKIALGHHREDIVETFLLNMFFAGKLESMPPKYKTDDGSLIVLRPLAFCKEKDIAEYAKLREFPIIPCNLCGSQPKLQRQVIKNMMLEWEKDYPDRTSVLFNSLKNVSPTHLLDNTLNDFKNISVPIFKEEEALSNNLF